MKRGNKRKFGREKAQRSALYKSLTTNLINYGKIKTTVAKAKSLSSYVEKIVTTAKKNNLASKRELLKKLSPSVVKKLTNEIVPKLINRNGGYTRITKLGRRKSDGSPMALIEFIS
jgi:large subunit ribosomal protein L17